MAKVEKDKKKNSKTNDKKDINEDNNEVVYLEGADNKGIEAKLQEILDDVDSEMELEEAIDIFVKKANSKYATTKIDGVDKIVTYASGVVKSKAKAKRSFSSKPTMPISCIMRNVGGVKQNFVNVTEETRAMKSNDDKIGIAGAWRRCLDCNRKWDTKDDRYGSNCPGCQSTNSVVQANQAVPVNTTGIMNRQSMSAGDISIFNKVTTSIFLYNEDTEEAEAAFLSLSGKQMELLSKIQLGKPFDINVSEDVFVNDVTNVNYFSTTGTSKVSDCSVEMADVLEIYDTLPLLQNIDEVNDGDFCTFFLEVVEEAKQPKEGGKWLIQLTEPNEEEDTEPVLISMYLDDEDVAKQFNEGDVGIFDCRYSEREVSAGEETELSRTINVNVETCGLPIFILGDDGTKFLSA